jgi:hypothetical protein
MWRVVAAFGGERYLHQVAVPCDPRYCFCATEVTSNIVFNCYLCLVYLYILIRNKKIVKREGLCQTNNKPDWGNEEEVGVGYLVMIYENK